MRTTWGVLCRTQEEAETGLAFLRLWTAAAGLTLHPTQTRLVNAAEAGSDFLSGHFGGGQQWRRNKSLQRLQEKLRLRRKRSPGRSLSEIIAQVNLILWGWHGYFRESHWRGLRRADGWLGRRLGAILRKREERPGNGLKSSRQPAVAEAVVCGAGAVESGTRLLGLRFVSRSCHGLESRMRENGSSGSGGRVVLVLPSLPYPALPQPRNGASKLAQHLPLSWPVAGRRPETAPQAVGLPRKATKFLNNPPHSPRFVPVRAGWER